MTEIAKKVAHGVDNIQPDGSFYCDGHSGGWNGSDRFGGAHWVGPDDPRHRWKRGTKPARAYASFRCQNGHFTEVDAERHDSPVDTPTKCSGTVYSGDKPVECESTVFTRSGGGYQGENCGAWPYDTLIPRTCSYCGGVHPEDLIELTKLGFKPEGTTKGYKYYVNGPDGRSLLPPIKFYTNHANNEIIERLNQALEKSEIVA